MEETDIKSKILRGGGTLLFSDTGDAARMGGF